MEKDKGGDAREDKACCATRRTCVQICSTHVKSRHASVCAPSAGKTEVEPKDSLDSQANWLAPSSVTGAISKTKAKVVKEDISMELGSPHRCTDFHWVSTSAYTTLHTHR